ncbi:hypothetical protein C8R45DRAFT_1097822 [Mycena sanguinolenta]|nr:hypothetical protein C8R45DRAFT_1097822 [Mycena sanguinolenta]
MPYVLLLQSEPSFVEYPPLSHWHQQYLDLLHPRVMESLQINVLSCPIDVLPRELLLKVLESSVLGHRTSWTRNAVRNVCALWRSIVDEEPTCWRDVDFYLVVWQGEQSDVDRLHAVLEDCRFMLHQSRSVALDLTIAVEHNGSSLNPHNNSFHRRVLNEVSALVAEAAPRTRSLHLEGLPCILPLIAAVAWPMLTQLALHLPYDPSHALRLCPPLSTPRLIQLSLRHWSQEIRAFLPDIQAVSALELFAHRHSVLNEATIDLFLLVLSLFPSLEFLQTPLDDVTVSLDDGLPRLRVPHLHRLCLSSSSPPSGSSWNSRWPTNFFWSYIETPLLKELTLPQRWFEMGPVVELNKFFESNSRIPSVIRFTECPDYLVHRWAEQLELVTHIFGPAVNTSPPALPALQSVCRWRRSVAQQFPAGSLHIMFYLELWDGGPNDVSALQKAAEECYIAFDNSVPTLLDVSIIIEHAGITAAPASVSTHPFHHLVMLEVAALLSKVAPCTRTLHIEGMTSLLGLLVAVPWPNLHALTIETYEDPSDTLPHSTLLDAPLLSSLFSEFLSPQLFAHRLPEEGEATLLLLQQVVLLFPILHELSIALDDIIQPLPSGSIPTTLPFLHRLHLSSSKPPSEATHFARRWITTSVWSYMTTPCLKDLTVPQRWFQMGAFDELGEFFERSSILPEVIRFIECPLWLQSDWKERHQETWPASLVEVYAMARSHPWESDGEEGEED